MNCVLSVFTALLFLGWRADAGDASRATRHPVWLNPKDNMEFVPVPSGKLMPDNAGAGEIVFTNGFWLGRTEVTVAQFRRFVSAAAHVTDAEKATNRWTWKSPGFPQADDHPVVWLSWDDALSYARWAGVDLPTESEWSYAARAGASTQFFCGEAVDPSFVWNRENASDGTRPAATRPPNAWRLHDMLGNAYEWCWIEERYGSAQGATGYPRGGSWTRCPDRFGFDIPISGALRYGVIPYDDDRGFRCIRRTGPAFPDANSKLPVNRVVVEAVTFEFLPIPAGEFLMGSVDGENEKHQEQPVHRVRIAAPFELGRTEVTVGQFRAFVQATGCRTDAEKRGGAWGRNPAGDFRHGLCWQNPEFPQTDDHPVLWVSWNDAMAFCDWLSRETATRCRLPSEAEWEYACRSGEPGPGPGGRTEVAWDLGWHFFNAAMVTHPVAQKSPTAWGLYDMHGGVWEWCADLFHADYTDAPTDGSAWLTVLGTRDGYTVLFRIVRGGAFNRPASLMRPCTRYSLPQDAASNVGFRVARSLNSSKDASMNPPDLRPKP